MRKVHLKVESLVVESFETAELSTDRGTVRAHVTTLYDRCTSANDELTCARRRTDDDSCIYRCECTDGVYKCLTPDTEP